MDLAQQTKELCRMYEIRPSRSKGQNFLINDKIYDQIVSAAGVNKEDTVLEVGPGLGFLTARLAKAAKKVVAVELDDKLANLLRIGLDSNDVDNVEIVNQDVLKFNPSILGNNYKVVANLPYNITSLFLRSYLERPDRPVLMVLMLQKEVAERICAKPGDMSLLALSIQVFANVDIVREVKAGNFWPEPEVDSAVIRIVADKEKASALPAGSTKAFFRLAKIGFSAKRKMLKNNLSAGLHIDSGDAASLLEQAGIGSSVRAEDLSVEDWLRLSKVLEK